MDQASAAQHEPLRPVPSARDRLAAAVRGDRGADDVAPPPGAPVPQLPADEGLEPVRPLGGDTWLVREVRSGERFALRLCTGRSGPERERSQSAARALAGELANCGDPHVVAVRGLLGPASAPVGLVEEYLEGGSLADRLAAPGRPDLAELTTVLRDAATGLAVLHERGRCHGGVTARRILFRAPGAPSGSPTAAVRPVTASGTPQDDVRDLGAVAWAALTGRAPARSAHRVSLALLRPDIPQALRRAVEAALAEDPSARPTARELAGLLSAPPGSVQWPDGTSGPRAGSAAVHDTRSHSRGRMALPAATVLLVVAAAGALERSWPAPDPAGAGAPPPATAAPTAAVAPLATPTPAAATAAVGGPGDPREALQELVALRGAALRTGNARLLERVYAPGAAAAVSDRQTIERTAVSGGEALSGLTLEVGRTVEVTPGATVTDPGAVAFVAEVRVDGYRGRPGHGLSVVPRGDAWVQTVQVVLVGTQDGWRLARVEPAEHGTGVPGPDPRTQDPRR